MKKISLIIAIAIIILSACSESFLDRQPEDTLAPGIFFKTPADIKTGLMAVYQPFQAIYNHGGLNAITEEMSDDGTAPFSVNIYNSFYKDNTYSASTYWNGFFKIIVNANNIIDIIEKYEPKSDA